MRPFPLSALALICLATGCADAPPADPAAPESDAWVPPGADTGFTPTPDAWTPRADAATPPPPNRDAANPPPPPPQDAATPPPPPAPDAATPLPPPPNDAGVPPPPPPDLGPGPDDIPQEALTSADPPGRTESVQIDGFTDDYLYSPDGQFKVGIRREWGATPIFFGFAGDHPGLNNTNVIDANDTGREAQIALYDPLRALQGCAQNAVCQSQPGTACPTSITYLGWNPVQGGNECNVGSGVEGVDATPGRLAATVRPLFWNPDWDGAGCDNGGCGDPARRARVSDVRYWQALRFVHTNIVELRMEVENLGDLDHPPANQEFPTLYTSFGHGGTPDLFRLFDSNRQEIAIDQPANDGFFYTEFDSPGGFATLQNERMEYGVGLFNENHARRFQGWQARGTFNNTRAVFPFGLPPHGRVTARAYLLLGNLDTVVGLADWLEHHLAPFGWLDRPGRDEAVGDTLTLSGWALDNGGVRALEVRIDGAARAPVSPLTLDTDRADVCLVWPGYADCPHVGFHGDVPVGDLAPGAHVLELAATDTDGNTRVVARRRFVR